MLANNSCIYIYIYIYRERERECVCVSICEIWLIYKFICACVLYLSHTVIASSLFHHNIFLYMFMYIYIFLIYDISHMHTATVIASSPLCPLLYLLLLLLSIQDISITSVSQEIVLYKYNKWRISFLYFLDSLPVTFSYATQK